MCTLNDVIYNTTDITYGCIFPWMKYWFRYVLYVLIHSGVYTPLPLHYYHSIDTTECHWSVNSHICNTLQLHSDVTSDARNGIGVHTPVNGRNTPDCHSKDTLILLRHAPYTSMNRSYMLWLDLSADNIYIYINFQMTGVRPAALSSVRESKQVRGINGVDFLSFLKWLDGRSR